MNSVDLIPKAPKRKRQPTAAIYREQLALAATEIIAMREAYRDLWTRMYSESIAGLPLKVHRQPWWRRWFS